MARGLMLCVFAFTGASPLCAYGTTTEDDAKRALDLGLKWLLANQESDGAWGSHRNAAIGIDEFWSNPETHRSWRVAVTALGCMTMLDLPPTEATKKAFDRGIDYIVENAMVKRISEWDVDNVWAYVYSVGLLAHAHKTTPADQTERRAKIHATCEAVIKKLKDTQTPSGGWGYYDFDAYTNPGSWATSFTTAVAILGLLDAREAGFEVDPKVLSVSVNAIKRSRLVNGAYTYSVEALPDPRGLEGIDQVKGSLSRIQVCNLALLRAGEPISEEQIRTGLDQFFKEHRFLDVARQKPIPHEAYYYNSGYFYFFGHYYASLLIARLSAEDQAKYWPKLRHEIIKTQETDGSMWDYPMNSYHRPYGTAFSVMSLAPSIPPVDVKIPSEKSGKLGGE